MADRRLGLGGWPHGSPDAVLPLDGDHLVAGLFSGRGVQREPAEQCHAVQVGCGGEQVVVGGAAGAADLDCVTLFGRFKIGRAHV